MAEKKKTLVQVRLDVIARGKPTSEELDEIYNTVVAQVEKRARPEDLKMAITKVPEQDILQDRAKKPTPYDLVVGSFAWHLRNFFVEEHKYVCYIEHHSTWSWLTGKAKDTGYFLIVDWVHVGSPHERHELLAQTQAQAQAQAQ